MPRARDLITLTGAAIVENFGYRQLNSIWRAMGFFEYLIGRRHAWGVMTRRGFNKVNAKP